MNEFEKTIKSYLDDFTKTDSHFATKYDPKKITECCNFIINEVRKLNRAGFTDDEIYQLARHFYLEDLKGGEKTSCNVVVNHKIELTEEDKKKAYDNALKEYEHQQLTALKAKEIREEKAKQKQEEKAKQAKQKQHEKAVEKGFEQLDLFGGDF